MQSIKHPSILQMIKDNLVEIWAGLSIFVGLPLVALLYFDWKAAIAVFVILSSVIGVLVVRKS